MAVVLMLVDDNKSRKPVGNIRFDHTLNIGRVLGVDVVGLV